MLDDITQEPVTTAEAPQEGCFTSFVDYRRTTLDLAGDLRMLQTHATNLKLETLAAEIDTVLRRMQDDKFNVVVIGEFKRGKSTLINALLGVRVAPTDVLPCTAVLTRVTYSIDKRAVIEFKDGHREEIAYDALPNYITKRTAESKAMAESIAGATIHYPSPYCQNNVDVIDTPGLNDDAAMTKVTLSVLPEADAAIMVIMASAPFGEYERDFLESRLLTADLGRVVFVVTGIDRMETTEDAERVIEGIRARIGENVVARARRQWGEDSEEFARYVRKIGTPRVYGISAKQAFDAKQAMDLAALERSGFSAFEMRLRNLLTEQRGAVMLQPPLNRTLTGCRMLIEAMRTREGARNLSAEAFSRKMSEAEAKVKEIRGQWATQQTALEETGKRVQEAAGHFAPSFIQSLKDAMRADIEAMVVTDGDLSDEGRKKKLDKEVERVVGLATRRKIDEYSQKLSAVVETILTKEAERLKEFDTQLSALMGDIAYLFNDFDVPESGDRTGERVALATAVLFGAGGIWSGYRNAGLKGAAVGLVASLGTGVAIVLATGATAATLPLVLAVGVASYFVGGWVTDAIFQGDRIAEYRERAIRTALRKIDRELSPESVKDKFCGQAAKQFDLFRDAVRTNAELTLSSSTEQLAQARLAHERSKTETEQDRTASLAARGEIDAVLQRAVDLSNRLARLQAADDAAGSAT